MPHSIADQYHRSPYPALTHPFTHPSRLRAIAALYGLRTPDPAQARILELGVNRGTNLQWIARSLPAASCMGLDLNTEAIRQAQCAAQTAGLTNLTYHATDLLDFDFGGQQFDYIIAHGFFSWVPEEVAQRLLQLCRDHLAEDGVALISYNTLPGCSVRDALRQLFLLEMDIEEKKDQQPKGEFAKSSLTAVDRVLNCFESALPALNNLPHTPNLARQIQVVRDKGPSVVLHDETGTISDPYYLLQFTQWAAETGLAYVADTDLRLDWLDIYPQQMRAALIAAKMPRLKALQYADYLFNTGFRRSLVCRTQDAHSLLATPDLTAILGLHIASALQPEGPFSSTPGMPMRFQTPDAKGSEPGQTRTLEVTDPIAQMVLSDLARQHNRAVPMAEVWARVTAELKLSASDANAAIEGIGRLILHAACRGQVTVYAGPY